MRGRLLLAAIPLGLALPFLIGGCSTSKQPVQTESQASADETLGYHLLRPTFLPRGMVQGHGGDRRGTHRVLSDYGNEDETLIIAQEQRSPERDAYNRTKFNGRQVDVNGNKGNITKGELGERRVTVYTPEATVVLSSATLSEEELITVARSMQ
jgi:Domain of unknown function (DUF4367)